jgi:hypothetical protein
VLQAVVMVAVLLLASQRRSWREVAGPAAPLAMSLQSPTQLELPPLPSLQSLLLLILLLVLVLVLLLLLCLRGWARSGCCWLPCGAECGATDPSGPPPPPSPPRNRRARLPLLPHPHAPPQCHCLRPQRQGQQWWPLLPPSASFLAAPPRPPGRSGQRGPRCRASGRGRSPANHPGNMKRTQ